MTDTDYVWIHPATGVIMIAPENKTSYFFKWLKRNKWVCIGEL